MLRATICGSSCVKQKIPDFGHISNDFDAAKLYSILFLTKTFFLKNFKTDRPSRGLNSYQSSIHDTQAIDRLMVFLTFFCNFVPYFR